jgi:bifunctional aspartokinase / homoserine dehydrogenase 1
MSAVAAASRSGIDLESPPAKVILVGAGSIGRALLAHMASRRAAAAPRLAVCAVVDRSGYLFDPRGLPRRVLLALCERKRAGRGIGTSALGQPAAPLDAVAFMVGTVRERAVLVDATAADTHDMLELVLERGWDIVLANKIPLAGPQWRVDRLTAAARLTGARILCEATVGAGLPVVDTLQNLIEAGDRVLSIEGCPSGTLGFVFGQMHAGASFSSAVWDAVSAGYAEPDPRVDLSGTDVARKALILARLLGFRGDVDQSRVESLVPQALQSLPAPDFLARIGELDETWGRRVAAARQRGAMLCYRARVSRRGVQAGLVEARVTDGGDPIHGADNRFAFTTARYRAHPLVISGPGAGAALAAAGVYNDLLRIARQRRR